MNIAIMITALSLLANPNRICNTDQAQMYKMHATAYTLTGKTASGEYTRQGICASGNREWLGKTIIVYQRNGDEIGDLIGIYECLDTGCKSSVIDVWCDGKEEAQEFINKTYKNGCKGKIFVQVIDAEG